MKRAFAWALSLLPWSLPFIILFILRAPWVWPGADADWLAQTLGVWSSGHVQHPLAMALLGGIGRWLPPGQTVAGLNLAAVMLGGCTVALLCAAVRTFLKAATQDPRSLPALEPAMRAASLTTAFALLLTPAFLRAGTHVQAQSVDLFLMAGSWLFTLRALASFSPNRVLAASFFLGLTLPEAPTVGVLAIAAWLVLGISAWRSDERFGVKSLIGRWLFPFGLGVTGTFAAAVLLGMAPGGAETVRAAASGFARNWLAGVLSIQQGSWLLISFFGVLPFVLALLLGRDIGNNRRSPAVLFTYVTLVLLVILAVFPIPVSPYVLLDKQWPMANAAVWAAMLAFAAGLTAGGGVLLALVNRTAEGAEESPTVRRLGQWLAWGTVPVLLLMLVLGGSWASIRAWQADTAAAALPKRVADAFLDCVKGGETWLLGEPSLDALLALRLRERQIPVIHFSLAQDHRPDAMIRLRQALMNSGYFAAKPELREQLIRSLDLGMVPFIQDWLRQDAEAGSRFVTIGLPDLWFTGNRYPLPERLWYRGAIDRTHLHKAITTHSTPVYFPALPPQAVLDEAAAPLRLLAERVRRQISFVANNTAFFLADAGQLEQAWEQFAAVYAYDSENISALFNLLELIHGGLHPEKRRWCEGEIRNLLKRLSGKKYQLWTLSQTFGYIRSPQLISALAGQWAMSGQTGAALSGLDLTLAMLDDNTREAFQGAIAALYNVTPGKRQEAVARYRRLLDHAKDDAQRLAYLRSLIRALLQEKNYKEAFQLLEQAEALGGKEALAYDRALCHAAAGETIQAQAALKRCLKSEPKHVEALAMLATLQLEAGDLQTLRTSTLQRLSAAAGTDDHYCVQIIRAQLAEREGRLANARAAYLRAHALNPDVAALRDTILSLDIRLNDRVSAERHARDFLYQDRLHPLSNYVMGSLALQTNDLSRAARYLKAATDPQIEHPLPEAFNDLAEVYRRQGDWNAALATARQAYRLAPNLSVAYETAAAALIAMGRLSEAENELNTADAMAKELRKGQPRDPRLQLTRALLNFHQGKLEQARALLAEVQARVQELDDASRAELKRLTTQMQQDGGNHGTL